MLFLILIMLTGCARQSDWHTISYPSAKTQFTPDFLPVSTWYSGGQARAPMLSEITENSEIEWRRDLQQIKNLGFNTVRTWVEWAHCEPRPGEYHFENLRLLCRLADEVGLKVFIQLYLDSAPDWVGNKYPDGEYEAQNGSKVHSQAAPGYCTDHPAFVRPWKIFCAKRPESPMNIQTSMVGISGANR
jgi:beta-galactosidase